MTDEELASKVNRHIEEIRLDTDEPIDYVRVLEALAEAADSEANKLKNEFANIVRLGAERKNKVAAEQ